VLAPPVMALMMLLVRKKKVMGELQVEGWLYWLGWLATSHVAFHCGHGGQHDVRRRLDQSVAPSADQTGAT
jgi:hypothetical protein